MYSGSTITDTVLDYTNGCANPNEVIRGFTSSGILLCILTSSATTSGFTGSLIGTERFVPRYTTNGTGITNSQIYDNSGATVSIGTGVVTSVLTRLEVLGGDINVNNITVGRGG